MIYFEILIWLIIVYAMYGIYFALAKNFKINYHTSPFFYLLLYGVGSALLASRYSVLGLFQAENSILVVILLLTLLVSAVYYVRFGYLNYFLGKSFEIGFQQVAFTALFVSAYPVPLSILQLSTLVALTHLPLIFFINQKYALLFTISSLFGSYIFFNLYSSLISGFYLAIAVHILFYLLLSYLVLHKHLHLKKNEIREFGI